MGMLIAFGLRLLVPTYDWKAMLMTMAGWMATWLFVNDFMITGMILTSAKYNPGIVNILQAVLVAAIVFGFSQRKRKALGRSIVMSAIYLVVTIALSSGIIGLLFALSNQDPSVGWHRIYQMILLGFVGLGGGLTSAVVLKNLQVIKSWGQVVFIALGWMVGFVLGHLLGALEIDRIVLSVNWMIVGAVAGLIGGLTLFLQIRRSMQNIAEQSSQEINI
jgi:hypothetical protein